MDYWSILFSGLVALAGIVVGSLLTRWNDRGKTAREIKIALRNAYADWLTQEELCEQRLSDFLPMQPRKNDTEALLQEIDGLVDRVEALLKASNTILVLETEPAKVQQVKRITGALISIRKLLRDIPTLLIEYSVMETESNQSISDYKSMEQVIIRARAVAAGMLSKGDSNPELPKLTEKLEELASTIAKGIEDSTALQTQVESNVAEVQNILEEFNRDMSEILNDIRADCRTLIASLQG